MEYAIKILSRQVTQADVGPISSVVDNDINAFLKTYLGFADNFRR